MTTSEDYRFGMAPKHPVPAPQTAPGAPQSPNPTTDTPGGLAGAQGRHPYEPPTEDA